MFISNIKKVSRVDEYISQHCSDEFVSDMHNYIIEYLTGEYDKLIYRQDNFGAVWYKHFETKKDSGVPVINILHEFNYFDFTAKFFCFYNGVCHFSNALTENNIPVLNYNKLAGDISRFFADISVDFKEIYPFELASIRSLILGCEPIDIFNDIDGSNCNEK